MTDGYAAWRTIEGPTHFGCLAHARRAFVDALKGMKKPVRAAQALDYFKALYQVETLANADPPQGETRVDHTYRLRQQHSVPLLDALRTWLDEQAPHVLPESLLGRAISYTRNQWEYLSHSRWRESQCNGLQFDAHVPRLLRRDVCLSPARTHRTAAALPGCRRHRSAAIQLREARACSTSPSLIHNYCIRADSPIAAVC
jgi:hypothetical protein